MKFYVENKFVKQFFTTDVTEGELQNFCKKVCSESPSGQIGVSIISDDDSTIAFRAVHFDSPVTLIMHLRQIISLFRSGRDMKPGLYRVSEDLYEHILPKTNFPDSDNFTDLDKFDELAELIRLHSEDDLQGFTESLCWVFPSGNVKKIVISNLDRYADFYGVRGLQSLRSQIELFNQYLEDSDVCQRADCKATSPDIEKLIEQAKQAGESDFIVHAAQCKDGKLDNIFSKTIPITVALNELKPMYEETESDD